MTERGGTLLSVTACVVAAALHAGRVGPRDDAPSSMPQTAVALLPADYRVVHGWPVLPENAVFDEISSVGVDSRGNVFVLHRGGRQWPDSDVLDLTPIPAPAVLVFDAQTGHLLTRWGEKRFALPHSLTVDRDDNVWITDVALHQVYKFTPDGRLLLTLGERAAPGRDRVHFNRPTDVAVDADGSFYVSDGYVNSRILKFAADGKVLLDWGVKGTGPGQFDLPHGIALDAAGRVHVVDRQNARVQIFDRDGQYVAQWTSHFVNPQDIAIGRDGTAFVTDIGDDRAVRDQSGVLVIRPDGSIAGRIGGRGTYDGQFLIAHGVAVGKDGALYVADFSGRRVQKFVRGKG
jgi:DNA-binding beta-propeller fold protein YncE